jgi:hypothetical protein
LREKGIDLSQQRYIHRSPFHLWSHCETPKTPGHFPYPYLVHQKHVSTLHACGAIDTDDLSVDPFTILGSEEADNTGNIDGETDTAERGPGSGVLVNLVVGEVGTVGDVLAADGVVHVSLDTTGGNDIDSDLLVTEV